MEAIEITLEGEIVGGPDPLERANELLGAPITFIMLQPGLADGLKLALEPAADNIDRHAPGSELINGRQLLGGNRRGPWPGQYRGNDLELFGRRQQCVTEGYGFMLELGAIAGGKADLRQRVVEAGLLGDLRQLAVVVDGPAGALFDLADDQPATDVRDPVRKFYGRLAHIGTPLAASFPSALSTRACTSTEQQPCH